MARSYSVNISTHLLRWLLPQLQQFHGQQPYLMILNDGHKKPFLSLHFFLVFFLLIFIFFDFNFLLHCFHNTEEWLAFKAGASFFFFFFFFFFIFKFLSLDACCSCLWLLLFFTAHWLPDWWDDDRLPILYSTLLYLLLHKRQAAEKNAFSSRPTYLNKKEKQKKKKKSWPALH